MKQIKLYNVMFPIWLLWLFPLTWIVVLPGNFIIDCLVVVLAMKHLKIENVKAKTKKVIIRVWIMGFVADFIGCIGMFIFNLVEFDSKFVTNDFIAALVYNPFEHVGALLWAVFCTIVTAIIIYVFNYFWCLKKIEISDMERKKVALAVAIFTAPYMFFFPTEWFV